MRVAYFPNQCAQNSSAVMDALLAGLRKHGHQPCENTCDADAALIWSVLWSGRMAKNQSVYNQFKNLGKPVVCVDVGALYRGQTWKIALNSLTAHGYYGHMENLDWDRPRRLGISLAINVSRNPRIVIASQNAKSLQVSMLPSMESWILKQVHMLQSITDRPIIVRPHPRSRLNPARLKNLPKTVVIEQPQKLVNTYDSYNLAFDCHAIVNYNSGPGIQAALAGTRPIVDESSLAYPVSIKYDDIEKSYVVDRDKWLVQICHTEYTLSEIEQGSWVPRLQMV